MVLEKWLKERPEAKIKIIEAGSRPALWRELRIRGTPSILLEDPKTQKTILLEGLADRNRLENALISLGALKSDKAYVGKGQDQ